MAELSGPTQVNQDDVADQERNPKLSKAQKKRLKQLAATELKKKLMRDQLLRELDLNKKSLKRGKLQWESLCKEIKLKEFREEIEQWGKKAYQLVERKDAKIEFSLKTIDETKELHEKMFSKHLDLLEYLSECHNTLRQSATAFYESRASEMIEDFLWGVENMSEIHKHTKDNNENIMHTTNVVLKDRLKKNYVHYMNRKFEDVTGEIEIRYAFRDETANTMKNLQDKLLLWIKLIQGDIVDAHKTEKFLYFMQRQRDYVKESAKLNFIERATQKAMQDMQSELLNIETESNRKMYGLRMEKAYFLEVRGLIKKSIERNKELTHEKLLTVSSESYYVINKLREFVKQGELLLGLAGCCNKYKTEKEKVVPWTENEPEELLACESDFTLKMSVDLVKLLDISEEELVDQMSFMKNFWRRCSNVRFHNLLLRREKQKLIEENEKYRNIIRSMKKSDDVNYILEALEVKKL